MSAVESSSTGGSALDTYAYRYDAVGNQLGWQLNNTVTSSLYNDLNQLTSVSGTGLLSISGSLSESGTATPGTVTVDGLFQGHNTSIPGPTPIYSP